MYYTSCIININYDRFKITSNTRTNEVISITDITTRDLQKIVYPHKIGETLIIENIENLSKEDWSLIVQFINIHRSEFNLCGTHIG